MGRPVSGVDTGRPPARPAHLWKPGRLGWAKEGGAGSPLPAAARPECAPRQRGLTYGRIEGSGSGQSPNFGIVNAKKWLVILLLAWLDRSMIIAIHHAKKGQPLLSGNPAGWFWLGELAARLHRAIQAAIEAYAPLGYEDETGFHFGVESPESLSSDHWDDLPGKLRCDGEERREEKTVGTVLNAGTVGSAGLQSASRSRLP